MIFLQLSKHRRRPNFCYICQNFVHSLFWSLRTLRDTYFPSMPCTHKHASTPKTSDCSLLWFIVELVLVSDELFFAVSSRSLPKRKEAFKNLSEIES